jgi:hypothetical protein
LFFALCRDRLSPAGCLVVNIAGPLVGPKGTLPRRIYAGIVEAFGRESVAAFGVPSDDGRDQDLASADNSLAVAVRGAPLPPPSALAARAADIPRTMLPRLDAILARRFEVDTAGVRPLSDPVDDADEALLLW